MSASPAQSARSARWIAVSEEEQAVSTVRQGPFRFSAYETALDKTARDVLVATPRSIPARSASVSYSAFIITQEHAGALPAGGCPGMPGVLERLPAVFQHQPVLGSTSGASVAEILKNSGSKSVIPSISAALCGSSRGGAGSLRDSSAGRPAVTPPTRLAQNSAGVRAPGNR